MRWLAVAALLAIPLLPAVAGPCNPSHPTPENPTIILGLVGGAMMTWRHFQAPKAK